MKRWLLLFVLLLPSLVESRNLHETVLDIPLKVVIENYPKSGSGALVDSQKGIYFVTAKHVLFNPLSSGKVLGKKAVLIGYTKVSSAERKRAMWELDLATINRDHKILSHSNRDVAVIQLVKKVVVEGQTKLQLLPGVINLDTEGNRTIPYAKMRRYRDVKISDDIYAFGYPVSIGFADVPQLENDVPLLRRGIVAGKNNQLNTLIIDSAMYGGNSGGPVIEYEDNFTTADQLFIGIVSQYVPAGLSVVNVNGNQTLALGNSGYAVVEPADYVIDLIDQAEKMTQ